MKNLIKASLSVVAVALLGACGFPQATPPCAVGHGGYSAKYTYASGTSDTSSPCFRNADIIGVQKYRQTDGTQDIYLKPEFISLVDYGSVGSEFSSLASGTLTANRPDADGWCSVGEMDAATGLTNTAALGGGDTELTYNFSNVQFYVGGSVAGTQFKADLTITGPGCSTTYTVDAMYPVVFCNAENADHDPISEAATADVLPEGSGGDGIVDACQLPDHHWSHYSANPSFNSQCVQYGNPIETGVDYDYALTGETTWFLCVPTGTVPSLIEGRN